MLITLVRNIVNSAQQPVTILHRLDHMAFRTSHKTHLRKLGIHNPLNQVLLNALFPHGTVPIVKATFRIMSLSLLTNVLHSVP